ncbi:hypothetical protein NMG60_11022379 [Bertholletia excelsa]
MNKATIIVDAITYIEQLQGHVRELSNQLLDLEAASAEESKASVVEATDVVEDINEGGIEPEVKVTQIEGNKLWIKILHGKERCGFVKLIEAISSLGFEFTSTSLTTYKGGVLFTACLEVRRKIVMMELGNSVSIPANKEKSNSVCIPAASG